jgi:hypothetical protein
MNDTSSNDEQILLFFGILAAPFLAAKLLSLFPNAVHTLAAWGVLVPAAQNPVVEVAFGDGLDAPRLLLLGSVLLILITWTIWKICRRIMKIIRPHTQHEDN